MDNSTSTRTLAYGTDGKMHVIFSDLRDVAFDNTQVMYSCAVRDSGNSLVAFDINNGTSLVTFDTDSKTVTRELILEEKLNMAVFAGDYAFMTTVGGTYRMPHGLSLITSAPEKISDSTSMSYKVSGSVVTAEDKGQLFMIQRTEFVPVAAGISNIQGL